MRNASEEVRTGRKGVSRPPDEFIDLRMVDHEPHVLAIALGNEEASCAERRSLGSLGLAYNLFVNQVVDESSCAGFVVMGRFDTCSVDFRGDWYVFDEVNKCNRKRCTKTQKNV